MAEEIESLRPSERLAPDWLYYWVLDHWVISSGEKAGQPYRYWPDYHFMQAYAKDASRRKVALKCAQVGISELSIAELYAWADVLQGNLMYVFPTDSIAVEFSRARLTNAHRVNEYLEGKLTGFETIRQFKFKENWIYIRGASVQEKDGRQYRRQLITVDASRMFGDEVDEWTPGVFSSLQARTGASSDPIERYVSVPRLPDGGISSLYALSDKKVWMVKCRACNEWQELTLWENVTNHEYPDLEHKIICKKCHQKLNRLEKEAGWCGWVAENPESHRGYSGYHFTKLFFPRADIDLIVDRFNNPEMAQDCWNDDLGLPYEPESKTIDDGILRQCAAKDSAHFEDLIDPSNVEIKSIGVDVGNVLNYFVRAKSKGVEVMVEAGKARSFDDIYDVIAEHGVTCGVVDAQPEFDASSTFCETLERRDMGVFKVAYFDTTTKERVVLRYDNQNPVVVHIGRNLALGKVLKEFTTKQIVIPPYYNQIDSGNFSSHMKVPVRIFRKNQKTGVVEAFFPKSRKPDHYYFAAMYSKVALELTPNEAVIQRVARF